MSRFKGARPCVSTSKHDLLMHRAQRQSFTIMSSRSGVLCKGVRHPFTKSLPYGTTSATRGFCCRSSLWQECIDSMAFLIQLILGQPSHSSGGDRSRLFIDARSPLVEFHLRFRIDAVAWLSTTEEGHSKAILHIIYMHVRGYNFFKGLYK